MTHRNPMNRKKNTGRGTQLGEDIEEERVVKFKCAWSGIAIHKAIDEKSEGNIIGSSKKIIHSIKCWGLS